MKWSFNGLEEEREGKKMKFLLASIKLLQQKYSWKSYTKILAQINRNNKHPRIIFVETGGEELFFSTSE